MAGINKVILVGNLGNDPEVRYKPDGGAITSISVATSESWKDKNTGQKQERTEWHNVTFFGKLAEIAGQYLKKGSQIYVEGKLQTDKYQDKQTNQDRYSTKIVVDGFSGVLQMLGSKGDSSQSQPQQQNQGYQNQSYQNQPQQNRAQQNNQQQPQHQGGFNNNFDDDIPFN